MIAEYRKTFAGTNWEGGEKEFDSETDNHVQNIMSGKR
jgi:hypothetical protein